CVPARSLGLAGGDHTALIPRRPRRRRRVDPVQVISKPHVDWFALAPVDSLLVATGIALLCAVLVPRKWRKGAAATVCAPRHTAAFGFAVAVYVKSPRPTGV